VDPLQLMLNWVVTNPTAIPFAGLVTFGIISIFRGWLVPGPAVRERIADKDTQITLITKERDDWKAAAQSGDLARQELVQQNKDLIHGAEATNRLLEAMRALFERQSGYTDHATGIAPRKEPD